MAMKMISVTDIDGFKIGNAENSEKGTGCTVIVCEEGAVGGVDVRGGGPATRETDLLRSENTVNAVNAVVLSGGSAFGLEAASGVMRELADMKIGFDVGDDIVVPIVCGASLYDLPVGDKAFPDINMGIQAVRNAFQGSFANGNHGAGTGATVGKLKGYDRAMKTGLGTFACGDGIVEVGAVAAVNAVGDIYNGAGNIIAGLRSEDGKSIYGTIKTLKGMVHDNIIQNDDSVSVITKANIEEALAAAAKQFKEQESLADIKEPENPVEETESESEAPAEETTAKFVFEAPAEETETKFAFEAPEEVFTEDAEEASEEIAEEPAEEIIEEPSEEIAEEPAEEILEEPSEEIAEEPAEVYEEAPETVTEEPQEEFIPETPQANIAEDSYREYAEISIPVAAAEPAEEVFEEPEEVAEQFIDETSGEQPEIEEAPAEVFEEPAENLEEPEELFEEPAAADQLVDETSDEQAEIEEAPAEVFEEPAENFEEPEELFEEPAEEVAEQFTDEASEEQPEIEEVPEEVFEEPAIEAVEQFTDEVSEEQPEIEEVPEEVFEEPAENFEEPEEVFEEPAEEAAEQFIDETSEEQPEIEEVPEEEPVHLTREDMGYDIVFNTTISCIITNASLTKSQANKLASILHDAYARAIKPVHGTLDGDTVFVLATGKQKVNFDAFAALATDVLQYAIIDGAMSAEGAYGLPAAKDMR